MRLSILFLAICSALDEIVTFRNLALGGVEFNSNMAWLISVNPLLYPIADATMIATAYAVDKILSKKQVDTGILWTFAGLTRLLCFTFSLFY